MAQFNGRDAVLPQYAPPSTFDAHDAFNELVRQLVLEGRQGKSLSTYVEDTPNWAIDFNLVECKWGREYTLDYEQAGIANNHGYFCRMEVTPYDNPVYSGIGFFTYQDRWMYFGRIADSAWGRIQGMPTFKVGAYQPMVKSHWNPLAADEDYDYGVRLLNDDSPYRQMGDVYWQEDYQNYDQKAEGYTDKVITIYEKDDYRNRRRPDDWLRFPKGSIERNKRGY